MTGLGGDVPAWAAGVRLRLATRADGPLLDAWRDDPEVAGEFNDFGPSDRPRLSERLASGPLVDATAGTLVVDVDGEPVGTVGWHAVGYGPNVESKQWNIGISLVPAARGRGAGWRAQRMLAEWLFATTAVNRVEASTDVENLAEQRSLEKAGFLAEGVLRGAQSRGGAWRDLVSYAILRADLATPPPGAEG